MPVDRLFRRIWNALAFASVTGVDDSGPVMMVQAAIGTMETVNLPAPQQFGFSSVPPLGSDTVAHFVGGDRSNGAITAMNHQATRPTGKQSGESMQFNAFGMKIYLSVDGITIDGGGKGITITNAPVVTVPDNLSVGTGATGIFAANGGVNVTVRDGIVTNIF